LLMKKNEPLGAPGLNHKHFHRCPDKKTVQGSTLWH